VSGLRATCLALVLVATVVGVAIFARGVWRITATVRAGRPLAGRWRPVGPRLASMLREVFGHEAFRHNPHVKFAHWTVMVSFPILFITLVEGYGEVTDARWTVPVVGHWPIVDWAVEGIAWLALVEGIVGQLLGTGLARWLPFASGVAMEGIDRNGLSQGGGALVVAAYALVFALIAVTTTVRRDVT